MSCQIELEEMSFTHRALIDLQMKEWKCLLVVEQISPQERFGNPHWDALHKNLITLLIPFRSVSNQVIMLLNKLIFGRMDI